MKLNNVIPQKNRAQAMVEFAIVLPILLLLLYGLLEAGRLLFIYSTIVTASRQAVRYGSATGLNSGGTTLRYQDCAGIRQAAQRVDYLDSFQDEDIVIQYDSGPTGPAPKTFCDGSPLPPSDPEFSPSSNNQRLIVTIQGDYLPIVPKIVPFLSRSSADTPADPITAESARTVLVSVSIVVTVPPSTWQASTPTATITKTPTNTPTSTNTPTNTPTDTPVFTPTLTHTPTLTPSPTITNTPTITYTPSPIYTPTITSTPVACSQLTHGPITTSGSTMSMTITNPYAYSITIKDLYVVWNHDKGHQVTDDKSLALLNASLGSQQFWLGGSVGPRVDITPPATLLIPTGTTTITFTFHQSYDRVDFTEAIFINLATPGCEAYPINATLTP
jgi:hypothetical protein